MKDKEQVFTNIKLSLGEVFGDIESYHVEHMGRDILIKVPSKYFKPRNWNGRGLNGLANVKLMFTDAHPNHVEDKEVRVNIYIQSFFNEDEWYGIDVSNMKRADKCSVYEKMKKEMETYFSSILNNVILYGEEYYGFNYEMKLLLDNFDDYDKAVENAQFLQRVITDLEQKVAEVVEVAKEEMQEKLNAEEDEYQRIKAQRNATLHTTQEDTSISIKDVVAQLKSKDLSQEQMKKVLEVIK